MSVSVTPAAGRAIREGDAPRAAAPGRAPDAALAEVVERLAPIVRGAGSDGEREAAEWIASRLGAAGATATVEEETFLDGYAPLMAGLAGAGLLAGLIARRGRARRLPGLLAAAAAAAVIDDASNGARPVRRALAKRRPTQNVVATAGDAAASRTLVVMAHHDAAPTGFIFDPTTQYAVADHAPWFIEANDTAMPIWWPVVAGPALVAAGALLRRRGIITAGAVFSAGSLAAFGDIARNRVVPGANDNLSAVAVLVALAERLRERPLPPGLRVLLVSCGAEEVLQGGIYGFMDRHGPALDPGRTWFLNLDTVGSPKLVLLEGEGPFAMEDYHDPHFRDLVAAAARRAGVKVRRGMRARASTDAVLPSRAGYPTACVTSVDHAKALSNYHLFSDTPENLDYATVLDALDLSEATARELAARAP